MAKGTEGRVMFLGWRGTRDFALTDRAREALAGADVVVVPPSPFDARALGSHGAETVTHLGADAIVARAQKGLRIVCILHALRDDDDAIVAAASANLEVAVGWLDHGPLLGKRILLTRTLAQGQATARDVRARGAVPIVMPSIEMAPPRDPAKLTRAIERMGDALCVVFTSANGVAHVWTEIAWQKKDARAFGHAQIAAIGSGTAAALAEHGITADVVATEFVQESLAEDLLARLATRRAPSDSKRIMILRAEVARDALPIALRDAGYEVDVVPVYETRAPDASYGEALAKELENGAIDVVTFTSSSTVDNLCAALGPRAPQLLARAVVASIGPITTRTCERHGVRVDVGAEPHTVLGLLDGLEAHLIEVDAAIGRRSSSD